MKYHDIFLGIFITIYTLNHFYFNYRKKLKLYLFKLIERTCFFIFKMPLYAKMPQISFEFLKD